jgi:hypothetical protein
MSLEEPRAMSGSTQEKVIHCQSVVLSSDSAFYSGEGGGIRTRW